MDYYKRNLDLIKNKNTFLYNKLKKIIPKKGYKVENNNIFIDNIPIHSFRDPKREAEKILKTNKIENHDSVVIIGNGLGYFYDVLIDKYPNKNIFVFEINSNIFLKYLENKKINKSYLKNIKILDFMNEEKDIDSFLAILNTYEVKNPLIIYPPSYKKLYSEDLANFFKKWREFLKKYKTEIFTNYNFQKRWIINGVFNFKHILNTTNILINNKNKFKNYNALLVAAGPSLDYDLDLLKKIKEEKKAFIFTVGSSINTLVKHGIFPDFAVSHDPRKVNKQVLEKINKLKIDSINLLFGSSVGFETVEEYIGPKYHYLSNQDLASLFLLDESKREILINDSPTVALVTLQILYKMGFQNIFLVGQNLAHLKNKTHSAGIDYYKDRKVSEKQLLEVVDVYGNKVTTEETFDHFRKSIENFIRLNDKKVKVINTTKKGANIEGAPFKSLEKVMEEDLGDKQHNIESFDLSKTKYNINKIIDNLTKLENSKKYFIKQIKKCREILDKVGMELDKQAYKKIEILYNDFDKEFEELLKNIYFKIIIGPMNRNEYHLLSKKNKINRSLKNVDKKARNILDNFSLYLDSLKRDYLLMENIFDELKNTIYEHKNKNS